MGMTAAERQAKHRKDQKQTMAALKAENEALRKRLTELETKEEKPAAKLDFILTTDRRFKDVERQIHGLDRRLDAIESMANQGF